MAYNVGFHDFIVQQGVQNGALPTREFLSQSENLAIFRAKPSKFKGFCPFFKFPSLTRAFLYFCRMHT